MVKKKSVTKKAVSKKPPVVVDDHRQYAVTACYTGLRNTGHSAMVSGAMLRSIGAPVDEVQQAANQYGDAKKEGDGDA